MSETAAIIDYGSGNLRSAEKALARAAKEAGLDTNVIVTDSPEAVLKAGPYYPAWRWRLC